MYSTRKNIDIVFCCCLVKGVTIRTSAPNYVSLSIVHSTLLSNHWGFDIATLVHAAVLKAIFFFTGVIQTHSLFSDDNPFFLNTSCCSISNAAIGLLSLVT